MPRTANENAGDGPGGARGLPLACRLVGHRFVFSATNSTMQWSCERGCGAGGTKAYASPQEAAHFAAAFNRRDSEDMGKRAPLFGLFPLRLLRRLRR